MSVSDIKDLAVKITAISTLPDALEMVIETLTMLQTADDEWVLAERIRETGDPNQGYGSIHITRENALKHRKSTENMLVELVAKKINACLHDFRNNKNNKITADYLERCFGYLAIIYALKGRVEQAIDALETIKETTGNVSLCVAQSKLAIEFYAGNKDCNIEDLEDLFDYYRSTVFNAVASVDSTKDLKFWLLEVVNVLRSFLTIVPTSYFLETIERIRFLSMQKIKDEQEQKEFLSKLSENIFNF